VSFRRVAVPDFRDDAEFTTASLLTSDMPLLTSDIQLKNVAA
jgi:hypothetical protein